MFKMHEFLIEDSHIVCSGGHQPYTLDDFEKQVDSNNKNFVIMITIQQQELLEAIYQIPFQSKHPEYKYVQFIRKFLLDESFRKKYLLPGFQDWKGTYHWNDVFIHPDCRVQIERLNQNQSVRFKDYVQLTTCGLDDISVLKQDKLVQMISKSDLKEITMTFHDDKSKLTAMRWVARGLHVLHSINKVLADKEVALNKKRNRR